jgi:hypothetical protein
VKGRHHYNTHYLFGLPENQKKKDQLKREQCNKVGITLIEIPFWWDGSKESIISTIHEVRPDLVRKQ